MNYIFRSILLLLCVCQFPVNGCGVAFVKLRKPITYFAENYQNPFWGMQKMHLLLEKQHNRGQDGAGIAVMKQEMKPGEGFLERVRYTKPNAIEKVFDYATTDCKVLSSDQNCDYALKKTHRFLGDAYLGHLRYATHSSENESLCQPFLRMHNVMSKCFAIAGNFNMTNTSQLFDDLVYLGLCPTDNSDTQTILEHLAFYLDYNYEHNNARTIDIAKVLRNASQNWDGGYVFACMLGNGDAFLCRDPAGIRTVFWYRDDEVFAAASERAALLGAFSAKPSDIQELKPGHLMIVTRDGDIKEECFAEPLNQRPCSFERIYFSRANDPDIYQERKQLGALLAKRIYDEVNGDLDNAVVTYVPNTGETAFIGLVQELEQLGQKPIRAELLVHKNQKLRTFITGDNARKELVEHIYDVTKGVVKPTDTLVVLDDSIVRGTTLRHSIMKQLMNLQPKRIIFVSSSPIILYPDCYGIDMSQLGRFIGFQAAQELNKERGEEHLLQTIYENCLQQKSLPFNEMKNCVADLYSSFSQKELEQKIASIVRSNMVDWDGELTIIYQSVDNLHKALPQHQGDWVFTGNYPTPGGYKVLNNSYIQWYEGNSELRAY